MKDKKLSFKLETLELPVIELTASEQEAIIGGSSRYNLIKDLPCDKLAELSPKLLSTLPQKFQLELQDRCPKLMNIGQGLPSTSTKSDNTNTTE